MIVFDYTLGSSRLGAGRMFVFCFLLQTRVLYTEFIERNAGEVLWNIFFVKNRICRVILGVELKEQ
jgi:hypothetical protein